MNSYMLLNPKAGLLKGLTDPAEIKAKLGDLNLDPEIVIASDSRGINKFIATVKAARPEIVLVAGGDGTVGTIIKGLMDTDVTFGLIPTGSTNNIGQSLGLSDDIEDQIKVINQAKVGSMDLGRANGQVFIESVGIGLLAEIMDRVGEQDSKKEVLKVVTQTIAEVVTSNIIPVHMKVDDGEPQVFNTVWLTVTNTGRAAAAVVDPSSKINDRQFEVVYCEPLGRRETARYIVAFVRNSHIQEDKFHRIRGSKLALTLPPGIKAHVDGVLKTWSQLEIEVIPGAIKVFVP